MNTYKVSTAYEYEPHTWKYEELVVDAPTSYLAAKMVRTALASKYEKVKILYTQKMKGRSIGRLLWHNM